MYPQQVFWNGVAWQQLPPPPRRGVHPGWLLLAVVLGLAFLLAAGATAANAYARHTICGAMAGTGSRGSTSLTAGSSATDTINTIHKSADRMRGYGRLLILDRALKSAIDGLATDMDELATLSSALTSTPTTTDSLARFFEVISSVNTHARDAQRACDLPADGIA